MTKMDSYYANAPTEWLRNVPSSAAAEVARERRVVLRIPIHVPFAPTTSPRQSNGRAP